MLLGRMAAHVIRLTGSIVNIIEGDYYDVLSAAPPMVLTTSANLMLSYDQTAASVLEALQSPRSDEYMQEHWKMVRGPQVLFDLPRTSVLQMIMNHSIHHRGQMTVYLRLLNIPVPGTYGPSADEK